MVETNVELARRGFEAVLRGDVDVIAELLHADVTWHGGDPSAPGACHNRRQALELMHRASGRRRASELVEVLGRADKVVVIMRVPAEDDEQGSLIANVSTFRDGKVVEMVHYSNPEDARAAAGV